MVTVLFGVQGSEGSRIHVYNVKRIMTFMYIVHSSGYKDSEDNTLLTQRH